ncbi:hypothetical protein PDIDSM_3723 [Penicillium digitatum]|nr:hypothetical protein PDIDSM_3723 [Penicillium digitatum]
MIAAHEQNDENYTLTADLASKTNHENECHEDQGPVPDVKSLASPKLSEDSSVPPLILHGAQVLVDDDGARDEKGQIKSRPMWDYLLQIEPASARSTGWMVFLSRASPHHPGKANTTSSSELEQRTRWIENDIETLEKTSQNPNAPKGVAGSGKAVFEGMTGVFGGTANSKKSAVTTDQVQPKADKSSRTSFSQALFSFGDRTGVSNKNVQSSVVYPRDSLEIQGDGISKSSSIDSTRESFGNEQVAWNTEISPSKTSLDISDHITEPDIQTTEDIDQTSSHRRSETGQSIDQPHKQGNPITADETQIAVELIFAVINELYTLSSAWNIRRTLLNAAKSYILRPGSPTLETVRTLLQDSMIEGHTSDDALGGYLVKLRENALPTEEERKVRPPPPSEEEKIRLRDTARRLFVQRGIPQALTSVMGAAASREALEKIFDSLQVESVARGFVFSILLQGLRVLTL